MSYTVIDVREASEYEIDHVEKSVNIPLGLLANSPESVADISKDADIIVYCRSGGRAEQAKNIFQNLGFKNVTNGINADEVRRKLGIK